MLGESGLGTGLEVVRAEGEWLGMSLEVVRAGESGWERD